MGLDYVSRFTEPLQRRLLRALEIAATGVAPSDITSTGSVGPSFVNTHQSWFIRLVTAAEGLDTRLSGISAGLADGDKGDVIVSGGGLIWNIQNGVLTSAKLGGDVTAAGKALLTAADAPAQRTALGLGTAATQATGTFVQRVGDTMTGPLVISGGMVTASTPVLDLSQTWNYGAVTFTGIKFNFTDTASTAGSLLMDVQAGGVSAFLVRKDGFIKSANSLQINNNTGTLGFGTSSDAIIAREAAQNLGMRNGANAQTWNVYGTYTDSFNYRRIRTTMMTGGAATIAAEGYGTGGSGNTLEFTINGSSALLIAGSGHPSATFSGTVISTGSGVTINANSSFTITGRVGMYATASGSYVFGNSAATDADIFLKLGVNTSAASGIKRVGTELRARLNDDSGFATIQGKLRTDNAYVAGAVVGTGYVTITDSTGTVYRVPVLV